MKVAGFTYVAPKFVDEWAGYTPGGGASETNFLNPLEDRHISESLLATRSAQQQEGKEEVAPSPNNSTDYRTALSSCNTAAMAKDPEDREQPDNFDSLLASYDTMLHSVDSQLNNYLSAYRNCMDDAGYDVSGYPALVDQIRAHLPETAPQNTDQSDAWQNGISYESAATDADASCRADGNAAGMSLLSAAIDDFRTTYSDQIESDRQQWDSIVSKANQYPGSPGF